MDENACRAEESHFENLNQQTNGRNGTAPSPRTCLELDFRSGRLRFWSALFTREILWIERLTEEFIKSQNAIFVKDYENYINNIIFITSILTFALTWFMSVVARQSFKYSIIGYLGFYWELFLLLFIFPFDMVFYRKLAFRFIGYLNVGSFCGFRVELF